MRLGLLSTLPALRRLQRLQLATTTADPTRQVRLSQRVAALAHQRAVAAALAHALVLGERAHLGLVPALTRVVTQTKSLHGLEEVLLTVTVEHLLHGRQEAYRQALALWKFPHGPLGTDPQARHLLVLSKEGAVRAYPTAAFKALISALPAPGQASAPVQHLIESTSSIDPASQAACQLVADALAVLHQTRLASSPTPLPAARARVDVPAQAVRAASAIQLLTKVGRLHVKNQAALGREALWHGLGTAGVHAAAGNLIECVQHRMLLGRVCPGFVLPHAQLQSATVSAAGSIQLAHRVYRKGSAQRTLVFSEGRILDVQTTEMRS